MQPSREAQYRAFFVDAYPDALRFAQRRSDETIAEEAVADAMLVLWRRFDEAPVSASERRAWLFGIVRNSLLNALRASARRDALAVRLVDHSFADATDDPANGVDARVDMSRAWATLDPLYQEALALAVLEGLSANDAAKVIGITAVGYRARLARARKAIKVAIAHPESRRVFSMGQEA